jgi:hypothetical protein
MPDPEDRRVRGRQEIPSIAASWIAATVVTIFLIVLVQGLLEWRQFRPAPSVPQLSPVADP